MKKTPADQITNPFKFIYGIKIPLPYILLISVMALSGILWQQHSSGLKAGQLLKSAIQAPGCPTDMKEIQLRDQQLISPILLADVADESEALKGLKKEITSLVQSEIAAHHIVNASVYLRSLNNGGWMCVNCNEPYRPGSLFKVPILITYLRQAELYPGLLDKEIYYNPNQSRTPNQTFATKAIEPGKKYTIRELFNYMIIYSDNNATLLLNENLNIPLFQKLVTDLGMPVPDVHDPDFQISAEEYSKFMRVLYNSSYLLGKDSEYALSLLTQTVFKDGMMKPLPADIKVAHKFGEWGNPTPGTLHQLHETGIVYLKNNPYLLTVMIKAQEVKLLPDLINRISKLAFDRMNTEYL